MYQDSEAVMEARAAEFWAQDFSRRMALAMPDDIVRGVLCNGLLRFARELGGEEWMRRCLEVGGEDKFLDFFDYPITSYLRMVSAVVLPLAARQGSVEESLRLLGRRTAVDLQGSAAGRALKMMNTGDLRGLMEVLRVAYRIAASSIEHSQVWTGQASARLTLRRIFMPPSFHEGLVLGVLESGNIRLVRVLGQQVGPLDGEFELCWD